MSTDDSPPTDLARAALVHREFVQLLVLLAIAIAGFFVTRVIAASNRDMSVRDAVEWYQRGLAAIDTGQVDQAAFAVPADVTLREGAALVRPLEAAPIGRYRSLAGGTTALPVLRLSANAASTGTRLADVTALGVPATPLSPICATRCTRKLFGSRSDFFSTTPPAACFPPWLTISRKRASPFPNIFLICFKRASRCSCSWP